jgi:arylsulfatase A-like enzyme/tetratricopeptide (TPR) repeat protein
MRASLGGIALAAWTLGVGCRPARPYNLLLVTIDTLRADHVNAATMPHLEQLATEGARFEHALSHVPLTLPSHASILTGLLPTGHGVRDNGGFLLRDDVETLAEKLKKQHYRTGAFVGAFVLDAKWGLSQGFDTYHDDFELTRLEEEGLEDVQRAGAEVERLASDWIRGASRAGSPFFAWAHFYDPHDPYTPPEPFRSKHAGSLYAGEVAYTDMLVGRLLKTLEEAGVDETTVVVVTSDHGEGLGEHREMTHGVFVYDSTLRVPLIIKGPLISERSVSAAVGLTDVFPTLLEILGLPASSGIDGRSLVPLVRGGRDEPPRPIYAESQYARLHYGWSPLVAVVTEGFKYIRAPQAEVFDLGSDPRETRNIIDSEAERARRMRELVEDWDSEAVPAALDSETKAKLEALGYVGSAPSQRTDIDPKDKIHLIHEFFTALSSYRSGNFVDARDRLDGILEEDSGLLDALFLRGVLAMKEGETDVALRVFDEALALKPDHALVVFNRALLYRQLGRVEDAIPAFERALELDPSQVKAAFNLAQILQDRGDGDGALAYYQKAIEFHTQRLATGTHRQSLAEIHDGLGIVYFGKGDIPRAESEIRRALELAPDLKFGHYNLAQILERQGRVDEAAEEYGREIERDPANLKARQNLGLIWRERGEWQKAIEQFRAVAEADPTSAAAAFLAAECYFRHGVDLEAARHWAERSVDADPKFRRGWLLLAEIYRRGGREAEARKVYQRGIAR